MWLWSKYVGCWCALCGLLATVATETIHFTNSPKLIMASKNFTTYEIEVPGSRPITIIEANSDAKRQSQRTDGNRESLSNAPKSSPTSFRTATGVSITSGSEDTATWDDATLKGVYRVHPAKKTLYSPDLLNKFLKEYSEKLRNADSITRKRLDEISMKNSGNPSMEDPKDDELPYGDEGYERNAMVDNKMFVQHGNNNDHKMHPFNAKDGWITLETVPWSESKVSKWQSSISKLNGNRVKDKHQNNYWSKSDNAESFKHRPANLVASVGISSFVNDDADDYADDLPTSSEAPVSFYNRRRPPASIASYNDNNHNAYAEHGADAWYDHGFKHVRDHPRKPVQTGDIITDGRPANFPKPSPSQFIKSTQHGNHPVSYPNNGNGEWVLISTTKGYQYPKRHGQRAITFSPATSTHQSVKLTVLPMKNTLDMTTSHNGLIEVSSSTQTVEDAVKQQTKKVQTNARPTGQSVGTISKRKKKKPAGPAFSLMRRDSAQDSSAVLAAVSAGMVPATMAFLAPMVLGK